MNPLSLNDASNSISVKNSLISGMSLGTVTNIDHLPKAKSELNGVQVVKQVRHWLTDSMLTDAPIIQSPYDSTKEHPTLQQPVGIDYKLRDQFASEIKNQRTRELYKNVMHTLEGHLQNENERKSYESESFGVSIIQEKHLPSIPKTKRKDHSTLGIRGVIAKKDLKAGSPLIYSAQYLTEERRLKAIMGLADHLAQEFTLYAEDTINDAEARINSYSFHPVEFESESYHISAYGAGNMCAIVNHDSEFRNMRTFQPILLDSNGNKTAAVSVYLTMRDIKKGEQLLVHYGETYEFFSFHESRQNVYF